jgi:signal transduction histidine kinase
LVAANLESGRVVINPEIVSLNSLAGAAWHDCKKSCPALDGQPISGPETSALADPVRVGQIIRNLLTNAVRYGGTTISIRVGAEARPFTERVRPYVEVLDNGAGVPLEHRESIFDPYYQATENESVLGSLGLGLAISRELARRMDGDLTYAYKKGHSVFRLELPAV